MKQFVQKGALFY